METSQVIAGLDKYMKGLSATLTQLDTALDRVALAAPKLKKALLEACVQVVSADGVIHEREAELLRAIADTLDCPIPPFVEITEN